MMTHCCCDAPVFSQQNRSRFTGVLRSTFRPQLICLVVQVNIIAMFSITKAAVEHMKPGSTIVNLSSVAGGRQGVQGFWGFHTLGDAPTARLWQLTGHRSVQQRGRQADDAVTGGSVLQYTTKLWQVVNVLVMTG